MKEQKPFMQRAERFFAGKGFYIVLFLCVAVIGVSAWSLLTGGGNARGDAPGVSVASIDSGESVAEEALGAPRPTPVPTPPPTAAPQPTVTPKPTAAPEATAAPAPVQTAAPAAEVREYYIWPVAGPIENGYSMTALAFNRTMQDWRTHDGVDIAAELGTQVKAVANGRVSAVREDDLYGVTVVLDHRDGLQSVYANLAAAPTVAVGETVGVGQVVGAVGDTALCETGEVCHLHFAMSRNGVSVDPGEYLP